MRAETTGSRPKPAFSRTHLKQSLAKIAHVKVYFSLLRGQLRGWMSPMRRAAPNKAFTAGFGRKVDEASDTMMTVIYSHH